MNNLETNTDNDKNNNNSDSDQSIRDNLRYIEHEPRLHQQEHDHRTYMHTDRENEITAEEESEINAVSLRQLKIHKPIKLDHNISCPVTGKSTSRSLNPTGWWKMLSNYPNEQWRYRLVHDIIYGVDVGFTATRNTTMKSRNPNADQREAAAIEEDIKKELTAGRVIGPFASAPWKYYRSSPVLTVAKKGNPGKRRIVHHLSHPRGNSVNDHIIEWPCILSRFTNAIKMVCKLGKGCHMAKLDIKSAYRLIPIRPADWPLLGFSWNNAFYFHTTLPFGLKSSCHLWERYSTAAQWIVKHILLIPMVIHYVDDYFLTSASAAECQDNMNRIQLLFTELGLTIATEKTVGPTKKLVFLGILIDTQNMTMSLDTERISSIQQLLMEWTNKKTCSLRELQSLIGTLLWAANVVAHGRTFIQFLRAAELKHNEINNINDKNAIELNDDCRSDIRWWQSFMTEWNGISLLWEEEWLADTDQLQPHTDACNIGYGAVCGTQWFHSRWTKEQQEMSEDGTISRDSMPFKELYALVTAATTWAYQWHRKRITFRTDCEPVVMAINKGSCRSRMMMQLIRSLHYTAATHHFKYRAIHIAGVNNTIADELSRVLSYEQLSHPCRRSIDPLPVIQQLPNIHI